ncbi:hypothetical protein STEG23_035553 [Scotinomys teguina]
MAEVPEDYDSGSDESQKLKPKRTKFHVVYDAKSDTAAEVNPEIDQEPEEVKTKEDDFEERKPGSTEETRQLEPDRTPEEEIPKETNVDLPSQAEPETTQVLETSFRAGGEDLEVPVDKNFEEADPPPPDVSVDVFTEPTTETDAQLPTETKVPETTSSELPEETGQNVPEQSLGEGEKEVGPEQNTPDFPSEEPRKLDGEVTKLEPPDQTLRQSTEEADIRPPEDIPIKSTEQTGTEQPEQVEPTSPDKKPRESIEEKIPEPLEERKLELSETPIDEASLELPEKATSEVPKGTQRSVEEKIPETLEQAALGPPKEIKLDVQGETQEKSMEEKVPEPREDRKPTTDQEEKLRKSSEKSQSKRTLVESSKEKVPVLQEQTEAEFPKEKLIKSTEETGHMPPQMTKSEVQEMSQPKQTQEKSLELSDEPEPRAIDIESPKEHGSETRQPEYPVGKDELVFSEYHKKMSEKETNRAKNEYMIGSPRESVKSAGPEDEPRELKEPRSDDVSELFPTVRTSESLLELRDSASEKKVVVLPQESEKSGLKESKANKSIGRRFEHLKWSTERVAEWISELGFPQYKECFTANFINGRKLIHVNCCNLPQMGITDFEDMKTISHHTRELLGIEEPLFNRSISLPYRDKIGLFLEQKSHSGVKSDFLTLSEFVEAAGLQDYDLDVEAMETLPGSCQEENEAFWQDNGIGEE